MIKSVGSAYSARKFVAYSGSESDLLFSLRYFNNVYTTFGEMFVPDIHRNLVKSIFYDLPKKIQTLIIRNGELPNLSKKEQVLIRTEGYVSIVKKAFASLPEETQALIVEKLKYYQVNGIHLNLKPSAALYQAYMEIQQQKEQILKQQFVPEPIEHINNHLPFIIQDLSIQARREAERNRPK